MRSECPFVFMQRKLRVLLSIIVVALGGLHAWNAPDYMNPDGISYLDLGDACLNGDASVINGLWSLLYPCVLGTALRLVRPSVYWEFPLVHLVNFAIYLFAFWAFDFLLCQLIRFHEAAKLENGIGALPAWLWVPFGYLPFLTCAFQFTFSPQIVSPDMCVVAFLFLASGILLRIRTGAETRTMFVFLGIALGLGYLSKAVFFPVIDISVHERLCHQESKRGGGSRPCRQPGLLCSSKRLFRAPQYSTRASDIRRRREAELCLACERSYLARPLAG
jgi:hypothetical protein